MTVHLIKLSVGPDSLAALAARQKKYLKERQSARQPAELMHITRTMPKRAEEVLDGGSIYWVVKGWLCARQRLLELRPVTRDGVLHCGLIYDAELIRVRPRPCRAFQGWRYLAAKDAPADLEAGTEEMPDGLRRELVGLL